MRTNRSYWYASNWNPSTMLKRLREGFALLLPSRRQLVPVRATLLAAALAGATPAFAELTFSGNVYPVDNFFSALEEGLPLLGNRVIFDNIINAEGDLIDAAAENAGQPFYERNLDVVVGENGDGQLRLTSPTVLRHNHLIIGGDREDVTGNGIAVNTILTGSILGNGTVSLEGAGVSYSNDIERIPVEFQSPDNPEQTRFGVPEQWNFGNVVDFPGDTEDDILEDIRRTPGVGYDAYVGLTGRGNLILTGGARAEIDDAVVVGWMPTAVGVVTVDGLGSSLSAFGGLNPFSAQTVAGEINQMIIGGYGSGTLNITNAGQVSAFVGAAVGTTQSDGEDQNSQTLSNQFDRGGNGVVNVVGAGSVWNVYASDFDAQVTGTEDNGAALAIGEFDEDERYEVDFGQGLLSIRDQGEVNVLPEDNANAQNETNGDLRVGRFGTVELLTGRLNVQDQIENDGVIRGNGRIVTGTYLNRGQGELRVTAGQEMIIRTMQEVGDLELFNGAQPYLMASVGLIEVLGDDANGVAVLEFDRVSDPLLPITNNDRFQNLEIANIDTTETDRGVIKARDSILRFDTGLFNTGDVEFIGGDNIVYGDVFNSNSGLPRGMGLSSGVISLNNESEVVFQDSLTNDGLFVLSDNSDATILGDFTNNGVFQTFLGGGNIGTDISSLIVSGDIIMGAGASLAIGSLLSDTIEAGDSWDLITTTGGEFNIADPRLRISEIPILNDPTLTFVFDNDLTDGTYTLGVAQILNPAMGGDIDGDNDIDQDDLDIILANFGLLQGATLNLGDFDMDGDVDATDFFLVQDLLGTTPAAALASAAVPEPTSAMLVFVGAGLMATRRRRS